MSLNIPGLRYRCGEKPYEAKVFRRTATSRSRHQKIEDRIDIVSNGDYSILHPFYINI
jgi:hypothetical protein